MGMCTLTHWEDGIIQEKGWKINKAQELKRSGKGRMFKETQEKEARKQESSQRVGIKSRELFEMELSSTYCQEMSGRKLDLLTGNWLKSHSEDWLNGEFIFGRPPSFLDCLKLKHLAEDSSLPDASIFQPMAFEKLLFLTTTSQALNAHCTPKPLLWFTESKNPMIQPGPLSS